MGGAPYSPAVLLVTTGDDTIEHYPPAKLEQFIDWPKNSDLGPHSALPSANAGATAMRRD